MKSKMKNKFWITMLVGAMMIMAPTWAMAVTAPCTAINNAATIDYSVNSVDQADVVSNTATFYVGVKVLFDVVTLDSANVTVSPGSTVSVLTFYVKNNGNTAFDYSLAVEAAANGVASPWSGNDSFNGTNIAIHVEDGVNPGYQAGNDSATAIDDLAVGANDSVYIVYTPSDLSESDNAVAVYHLSATALYSGDGSSFDITASGNDSISNAQIGTCNGETVDVVLGDADGPATGDDAGDGTDSDTSAYEVSSATIAVTKGYTVISDPINGSSNPKAIPGAVIEYSIAIANTGGSSATLTTITDAIDTTNLTIDAGAGVATWAVTQPVALATIRGAGTISGTLTADGSAPLAFSTPNLTATMGTILAADSSGTGSYTAGELKAGEVVTLTFRATVK